MSVKFFERPIFRSRWFYFAALMVLALFFVNLGSDGIYSAQEGRTAILARHMLRTGNYLEMVLHGGVPYEKPIFYYWIVAASGALFGLAGDAYGCCIEFALRLPTAIGAVLGVLGAAMLAAKIYGNRTGLMTAVILSSMMTYNNLGRLAHIDMAQTTAMVWSMYFLYLGYIKDRKVNHYIYGFYLMLGLGMLLKGPLNVILAGLVCLAWMIRYKDWKMPLKVRPLPGAVIFLVVGCTWYVFEYFRTEGAFFTEFIVNQNVRRYTGVGSTYRHGEWMSPFYYFQYLLAGALPWSPIALIALIAKFKTLIKLRIRPESFYLLAWFVTTFIFLTFSALKRADYLLPAYPALAIMTARAIELFCERNAAISRRWRWIWVVLAAFFAIMTALNEFGFFQKVGAAIVERRIAWISKPDGVSMLMLSDMVFNHRIVFFLGVAVLLGVVGYFLRLLETRRAFHAFVLFTGATLAVLLSYHLVIDPMVSKAKTLKEFCREVRTVIGPDEKYLYLANLNTEMIFYLDRDYAVKTDLPALDCQYLIIRPKSYHRMKDEEKNDVVFLLSTPERHEYPEILFRFKPEREAEIWRGKTAPASAGQP